MTRETKIGLLVGLAFIIVIGILLSDHLSSATEPPRATLSQAGPNVRQAVSVPGGASPPITTVVAPEPSPQQPVPIGQDLTPKPPPVQIVQIGPSSATPTHATTVEPAQPGQASQPEPAPQQVILTQAETVNPPANQNSPTAPDDSLDEVARQMGEEIVRMRAETPVSLDQAHQQYKAQEGDSLSRMAARFYGSSTKATRDLIISANPSLQRNPDIVVIGRTYTIPAPGSAPVQPALNLEEPAAAEESAEYNYTVKDGDTLWKIASQQLGDANAVAAIQAINDDILHGGDIIRVGMKLRLPAKPVASAQ